MKKKPTISKLRKKCWKLQSEYNRRFYADENGMVECVACKGEGKTNVIHYKNAHCAHFIPKSMGLEIMFYERNIHPCCVGCNMFKHGNLSAYAIWIKDEYGDGIFDELMEIRNKPPMGTASAREFLENKITELKVKLAVLGE